MGHPQHPGGPLLRQPLEIAEQNRHALLFRQLIHRLPQGDALHKSLLRGLCAQQPLQRKAVRCFPLQGIRCLCGQIHLGDLLRCPSGLGRQFGEGRLPPQLLPQPLPQGIQSQCLLPDAPSHLDGAVIPEKPPDLPGDLGDGIGGKAGAVGKIKPPDRFQKPKTSQLVQVVRLHSPAVIPADHTPDQAVVFQHCLLTCVPVPLLSRPQQLHGAIHRLIRGAIFFFITTVVPRPATDRTFKLSIKLSMMVKPMPLRSSPPVVNMGCRAFSTSGMPRP